VSKRKKVASVMFTGAAATALVGAGVQPAAAQASNWTVTPGGAITGTNQTTATLTAAGVTLNCSPNTVNATGNLPSATTGNVPIQLGTIDTTTFGTEAAPCSLFGLGVTATLDNAIGINATDYPSGGATPGFLGGNINATVEGVGWDCDMHVTGESVPATYNNSGLFQVNPNNEQTLHIDSVSGCFGLFNVSDPAAFQADFTVDPVQIVAHS
jgi:hypothetical protein